MHPKFNEAHFWSHEVIGAAIEVHRQKGPGLLEDIYQQCLIRECELRGIPARSQVPIDLEYKGMHTPRMLRMDLLVADALIIELKAVERVLPVHKAQLLSYMKLLNVPIGLLINFHVEVLKGGLSRLILPGADQETPKATSRT